MKLKKFRNFLLASKREGKQIKIIVAGHFLNARIIEIGEDYVKVSTETSLVDAGNNPMVGTYIMPFSNLAIKL